MIFFIVVQFIYIVLKLTGYLVADWWIVLVPMIVFVAGFVIFIVTHWCEIHDDDEDEHSKPTCYREF